MNVDRLLRVPVTITRVEDDGPPDDFGDPTETTTTVEVRGYAWQVSRSDVTGNTEVLLEEWRLALPSTAQGSIDGGDRVTVEGITFEVEGPPWPARNPRTNRIEHLEATLRKATT